MNGMPPDQVLLLLQGAEPPTLSRPYSEVTLMTLLTSMADTELVHMIAWAKKLPGFLQLGLHAQVQLLESSWLEVLMFGLIWRSIHCPGKLIFAQDLILDRNDANCVEGMAEIFDMLLATASRFRLLKLKPEEFVCLKAIILLNSGAFSFCTGSMEALHDTAAVQIMLDTITDTLIHHISQSGGSVQQQSRRQAQLLLLLSHITHTAHEQLKDKNPNSVEEDHESAMRAPAEPRQSCSTEAPARTAPPSYERERESTPWRTEVILMGDDCRTE